MKFFIDDERVPRDCLKYMKGRVFDVNIYAGIDWRIFRTFEEMVEYMKEWNKIPDFISFDHDLGDGKDGYDCAVYLVEYCLDNNLIFPPFCVHSQNPVGKERIETFIKSFKKYQQQ